MALHQLKHPKDVDFAFEHRWVILREVPRRVDLQNDSARTPNFVERKCFTESDALVIRKWKVRLQMSSLGVLVSLATSSNGSKRPPSVKRAKNDLDNGMSCEQATYAQTQASLEMAQSLQDMAAQQLFGINIAENLILWHVTQP